MDTTQPKPSQRSQQHPDSALEEQRIEAAVFRRLLAHLDAHRDVQNIDLMNLAGFCRNCLAKWYTAAATEMGKQMDYERARERVYGMPYEEWKRRFQREATPAAKQQDH